MKIVHIALQGYKEGLGYQENLLPKYHKKLGHEVSIITSQYCDEKDRLRYENDHGISVYVIDKNKYSSIANTLQSYDICDLLSEIDPNYIFVHDLQGVYLLSVKRYVKKADHKCTVVADNHSDTFNDGYNSKNIKHKLARIINRNISRKMQGIYKKVYGVTPGRVEYAHDVFGIDKSKIELLVMGADDEFIDFNNKDSLRKTFREKHNIPEDAFVLTAGGRIDKDKKILELVRAFKQLEKPNLILVIYGNIVDAFKDEFEPEIRDDRIRYIGFLSGKEVYDMFLSCDLAVFPGGHSVLWEQAVACRIPSVFQYREGLTHVNINGNCDFFHGSTEDEILKTLKDVIESDNKYLEMKESADSCNNEDFLCSGTANKTLSIIKQG